MKVRRSAIAGFGALAVVLVASAAAWACVSGPSATLNLANAKPGDTVTLTMRDFRKADPIQLRWNDLGAPTLATFEHNGSGSPFTGTFAVPADAKPGNYVLVLTQTAPDGKLAQMPVRTLITVTSPNGSTPVLGADVAPVEANRPVGLVTEDDSTISGGTLALVALGVGGVAMFLAGMAALLAGRGRAAEVARVRS
jgi:hypothetical protein